MSPIPITVVSYKQTKEEIKEFTKDVKKTGRWLIKTGKKLKKFNERDIFEEHDTVAKQLKELNNKVNEVISVLSETTQRTGESIEDIGILYGAILALFKRVKHLEEIKNNRLTFGEGVASAARNLLGNT